MIFQSTEASFFCYQLEINSSLILLQLGEILLKKFCKGRDWIIVCYKTSIFITVLLFYLVIIFSTCSTFAEEDNLVSMTDETNLQISDSDSWCRKLEEKSLISKQNDFISESLKCLGALVLVLGLFFLMIYFLRLWRSGYNLSGSQYGTIEILDSYCIGGKSSFLTIQWGSKLLLVVRNNNVWTLLSEITSDEEIRKVLHSISEKKNIQVSSLLNRLLGKYRHNEIVK